MLTDSIDSPSVVNGLWMVEPPYSWLEIRGKDRIDLLHRLSTNDLAAEAPGKSVDTCFLNVKGRVVELASILILEDAVLAIVSKANDDAFISWIDRFTFMEEIRISRTGPAMTPFCLIGQGTTDVVRKVIDVVPGPGSYRRVETAAGPLIISCPAFCEGNRFDLLVESSRREEIIGLLRTEQVQEGREPEFDTLRIAHGIPSFPNELSGRFTPYDIGLRSTISFTKGCYIGQEVIARLDTYDKVRKELFGVLFTSAGTSAPVGAEVTLAGSVIGELTSVSRLSFQSIRAGLAVLTKNTVRPGSTVFLGESPAMVCGLPISDKEIKSALAGTFFHPDTKKQ